MDVLFWFYSVLIVVLVVDSEDICWQPVSNYTAEAVNVSALPGHERLTQ